MVNLKYRLAKQITIAVLVFLLYCVAFHCFDSKAQIRERITTDIFNNYEYSYNDSEIWSSIQSSSRSGSAIPYLNAIRVNEEASNNSYILTLTHEISHCYNYSQHLTERENEFMTFKYLWESGTYRASAIVMLLRQLLLGWISQQYYCGDLIVGYLIGKDIQT